MRHAGHHDLKRAIVFIPTGFTSLFRHEEFIRKGLVAASVQVRISQRPDAPTGQTSERSPRRRLPEESHDEQGEDDKDSNGHDHFASGTAHWELRILLSRQSVASRTMSCN